MVRCADLNSLFQRLGHATACTYFLKTFCRHEHVHDNIKVKICGNTSFKTHMELEVWSQYEVSLLRFKLFFYERQTVWLMTARVQGRQNILSFLSTWKRQCIVMDRRPVQGVPASPSLCWTWTPAPRDPGRRNGKWKWINEWQKAAMAAGKLFADSESSENVFFSLTWTLTVTNKPCCHVLSNQFLKVTSFLVHAVCKSIFLVVPINLSISDFLYPFWSLSSCLWFHLLQ